MLLTNVIARPNGSANLLLEDRDKLFDPQTSLLWVVAATPHYHTRIADGTRVRDTRSSMDYALALLQSGEASHADRACDVIDAVVALQVTDPLDEHYGIWGWFYEEPPGQMNPADWNWADFIGARLAQALITHGDQLRDSTRRVASASLRHAALSIFRRNVSRRYTNIAIMGGVVTLAAGELLDMADMLAYGRRRLASVLELAEQVGGFAEYNSPTYTRVALEETERCLMLVQDPASRKTAESLRRFAWKTLAERFHPGTGQMAGPISRAYSDRLQEPFCRYLREQTGAMILPHRLNGAPMTLANDHQSSLVRPLPCPPEFVERFQQLPADPQDVVTRFATSPHGDTVGTTWLSAEACLGTVNRGHGWTQQRGLLGYWRTTEDPAMVLRVRLLNSGVDFSASRQCNVQRGPRAISSWTLARDAGPFHPSFDRPAGDVFELTDLRLRVSLRGKNARAQRIDDTRFELRAGDWRAVLHTAPAQFAASPVRWEVLQSEDLACVDAILHCGDATGFNFQKIAMKIALGVELLPIDEPFSRDPLKSTDIEGDEVRWQWGDLDLSAPTRAAPFEW